MEAILPCAYAQPRRDAPEAFNASRSLLPDFAV
jgi:hypothetical protein